MWKPVLSIFYRKVPVRCTYLLLHVARAKSLVTNKTQWIKFNSEKKIMWYSLLFGPDWKFALNTSLLRDTTSMSCPGVTVAVPGDNQCLQIYSFLFRNRYRILSLSAVVVAKESTSSEEERDNYNDLESEDRQYMGPSSIPPLCR
jgi:hypothetical protein